MQTLRTKKRVKKEKRNVLFHRGQLDPNITLYLICDICHFYRCILEYWFGKTAFVWYKLHDFVYL